MPWGTHQYHGGHLKPLGIYSQQLYPEVMDAPLCPRAIAATALLVKTTEEIVPSPL